MVGVFTQMAGVDWSSYVTYSSDRLQTGSRLSDPDSAVSSLRFVNPIRTTSEHLKGPCLRRSAILARRLTAAAPRAPRCWLEILETVLYRLGNRRIATPQH